MTKIGLFGIGLDTYWPQFKGLKDKLTGYQNDIFAKMKTYDVQVINGGLVDNPVTARETGAMFQKEGVELVFLYISTYALSHTVLPVLQAIKVPVIILNIQPAPDCHMILSPVIWAKTLSTSKLKDGYAPPIP